MTGPNTTDNTDVNAVAVSYDVRAATPAVAETDANEMLAEDTETIRSQVFDVTVFNGAVISVRFDMAVEGTPDFAQADSVEEIDMDPADVPSLPPATQRPHPF